MHARLGVIALVTQRLCDSQFKVYLIIEGCIWLPAAYMFCYRFQPTVRFVKTDAGRRAVLAASGFLERNAPSTHASLVKLADRAQGAPAGRAAAEWALLNKVGAQPHAGGRASIRKHADPLLCMCAGVGTDWLPDKDVDCASCCEKLGRESSGGAIGRPMSTTLALR